MKRNVRIIARLDIKAENVIKGVHFEGLRIIGNPNGLARKYVDQGADEIIYIDSVASLYGRNNLHEIVRATAQRINIPITVGGGIRNLEDIRLLLLAGADKVAINTQATKTPMLLSEAAKSFGSQCILLSITAKKVSEDKWVVWTDNAREPTDVDVVEWARKGEELGVGEIIISSIDMEGTMEGFDNELCKCVSDAVNIPVIGGCGAGNKQDVVDLVKSSDVCAVSLASILHYNIVNVQSIKQALYENDFSVRLRSTKKYDFLPIKEDVSILDYGIVNIYSVHETLKNMGAQVKIVKTVDEILDAKKLILPGVGAFKQAMKLLSVNGLDEAIKKHVKDRKPLLGICLGAQLLLSFSEEHGYCEGLNLIEGKVVPLERDEANKIKVPHIGWDKITKKNCQAEDRSFLRNLDREAYVYFVHSFKMMPESEHLVLAECSYGPQKICALFQKDNVVGCQFHPEKSDDDGMRILYYFCTM
jgi:imidazole glycerol phosphate synthase glutamine amidotransferase subunit